MRKDEARKGEEAALSNPTHWGKVNVVTTVVSLDFEHAQRICMRKRLSK